MPFFKFHFVEASRMAGIQYEGKELQSDVYFRFLTPENYYENGACLK